MTANATPDGVRDDHVVVPQVEGARDVARLSFDNGLGRLEVRAGENMADLLEARFTEPLPVVWAANHNVHVEYPLGSRLMRRMRHNVIQVNAMVPWAIDVHGGAEHLDADLTGVDVHSVAFHAGAAHLRLRLGHPTGSRAIRLASVKDLRIERPAGVPVRVEVAKGATNLTVDDRRLGAAAGRLTDQTPGYPAGDDCYLVIVSGGADTLTVSEIA